MLIKFGDDRELEKGVSMIDDKIKIQNSLDWWDRQAKPKCSLLCLSLKTETPKGRKGRCGVTTVKKMCEFYLSIA